MPLEVIDDIEGAEEKIRQADTPPYVFVNACYKPHDSSWRSKFEGCKMAYEILEKDPDSKVILYGVLPQIHMYMIPDFQRVMIEHPENIRYWDVISKAGFSDFGERDPFKKPNHVSPALKLVAGRKFKSDRMSYLKHDLGHIDRGMDIDSGSKENIIEGARKLGLSGTDEEVEEQIRNYQHEKTAPQFNERLVGVYCDVEGTLLRDGELNKTLREELEDASYDKPVTIWTGSDPVEKILELNSYHLEWPLLNKDWFRGCTAEHVIDDMKQDEFEKEYGIKAETFRQIQ